MRLLSYGPDARLKVKVSARNIVWYRDMAAILMDQLKEIWIDRELGVSTLASEIAR
jgi:peptide/nickel transport system substrate-binding protein